MKFKVGDVILHKLNPNSRYKIIEIIKNDHENMLTITNLTGFIMGSYKESMFELVNNSKNNNKPDWF